MAALGEELYAIAKSAATKRDQANVEKFGMLVVNRLHEEAAKGNLEALVHWPAGCGALPAQGLVKAHLDLLLGPTCIARVSPDQSKTVVGFDQEKIKQKAEAATKPMNE